MLESIRFIVYMIKVLPQHIVSKIAAGEVVERPVSIIKELVENSIDAKATKISIEIEKGGKEYIRVIDNGIGISKEDLELTIAHHATSKLSSIEDLDYLSTFGFRGEALSSIAAVAKLHIQSTVKKADAHQLQVDRGEVHISPCALAEGTTITVTDLFYCVPVRRKYLTSDKNEYEYILRFLMVQTLSHPEIEFVFRSNNKEIFHIQKTSSLEERVQQLYGTDFVDKCVPLFYEGEHVKIRGVITKPQEGVRQSPLQNILVNNRVIKNTTIAGAILSGYEGLLMVGNKPQYIISIDIDPKYVDCNVHPRKAEVRFANNGEIFIHIKKAVSNSLLKYETRPSISYISLQKPSRVGHITSGGNIPSKPLWKENTPHIPVQKNMYFQDVPMKKDMNNPWKILGQLHNSYLLVQTDNGLLLVDQHAAHERINYEKLRKAYREKKSISQKLTVPVTVELSTLEWDIWSDSKEFLLKLGFEIENFGGKSIAIHAIPVEMKNEKIEKIVRNILQDFSSSVQKKSISDTIDEKLATVSCRMSIMFGDKLSFIEQETLIRDLRQLTHEYCPHGRPATIELSLGQLEKIFKRIL